MGRTATRYPQPPEHFRHARGWLLKAIGKAYLRFSGWKIEGAFPTEPKVVTIVAPHTSNWDFLLGIAIVFAVELRSAWLGKHAIFRFPFRRFLRWMGGIPVDRRASHGVVEDCATAFREAPTLMLTLAPEGTRKGVSQWRTGFYHIATQAGVPLFPVGFDFAEHVVRLMPLFRPSGNLEADLPLIQAMFNEVQGLKARPIN